MITNHTKETLIAFEKRIQSRFANGELPFLIHLSGGNEEQLLDLYAGIGPDDWVFSTHRGHYHALLKGIPEEQVEMAIRQGRSMFIFSAEHKFYTSSILGGCCGIAAGVAKALKDSGSTAKVWCFLGDGAEDNGHLYEAVLYVTGNDLPCRFIIEDNNRSVDTPTTERTGGYRMDWPWCVKRLKYEPTYAHGGANLPPGSVTFQPEIVKLFTPV